MSCELKTVSKWLNNHWFAGSPRTNPLFQSPEFPRALFSPSFLDRLLCVPLSSAAYRPKNSNLCPAENRCRQFFNLLCHQIWQIILTWDFLWLGLSELTTLTTCSRSSWGDSESPLLLLKQHKARLMIRNMNRNNFFIIAIIVLSNGLVS